MQLSKEQEKIMLPNRLRMRVARMFRMLFSAKIPCPQIILEKEYEMIGEAIRDIRESDADIKILSDAELKEFFPDGLMASIDRTDSLPSPTLERKFGWKTRFVNGNLRDGEEIYIYHRDGNEYGSYYSTQIGYWASAFGHSKNCKNPTEAKEFVETTVSSELNSLGSDGRILQAVKEGKEVSIRIGAKTLTSCADHILVQELQFDMPENTPKFDTLYSGTDPNTALDALGI